MRRAAAAERFESCVGLWRTRKTWRTALVTCRPRGENAVTSRSTWAAQRTGLSPRWGWGFPRVGITSPPRPGRRGATCSNTTSATRTSSWKRTPTPTSSWITSARISRLTTPKKRSISGTRTSTWLPWGTLTWVGVQAWWWAAKLLSWWSPGPSSCLITAYLTGKVGLFCPANASSSNCSSCCFLLHGTLLCTAKRQYLLTWKVSRYCLLTLYGSTALHMYQLILYFPMHCCSHKTTNTSHFIQYIKLICSRELVIWH